MSDQHSEGQTSDLSDKPNNGKSIPDNHIAIAKNQTRLRLSWLLWLGYRSLLLPLLLGLLLSTKPAIIGGIVWQVIWLLPALVLTPWMIKGQSPYALLVGSMLTLVYFGASGVMLFTRFYDSGISAWWVYALDTVLILMVNVWLFKLLKVLPSMNKVGGNE